MFNVSRYIKQAEPDNERRAELIEEGEGDHANLTAGRLSFDDNKLPLKQKLQILESVHRFTTRHHAEFYKLLVFDLARLY